MEDLSNYNLFQEIVAKCVKSRNEIEDRVCMQYLNHLAGSPSEPIFKLSDERLLTIIATHRFEKRNSNDNITKTHFIDNGITYATLSFNMGEIVVEAGDWYNVRN